MDDFEEVRHLGRGAFGEVLLMRQTSTGLLCAVKKLGKTSMTAGEEAEHLAEVKALQALQHPCILRYYGSMELDESLSLVMEFADAGDLQHLLKGQADAGCFFEVAALFALFSQLVMAVAHVHSNRVLHRDLKPSNVMLTSDGLVKLGDFGVAKVLAGTTVMDNLTCVGSPTYMAPEIVSGEPYGAACDVWSLGVILYEMASFQRPFEGRSLGELVMRISSGQFKDLNEHLKDKPGGNVLEEAVRPFTALMLVLEPKQRGSMKEVVRLPTMQVFASSLKTSAVVVAALVRELQEPGKSKGIEIDSAAVDDLIAELASSPKRSGHQDAGTASPPQVRSSLQTKAKQTVEEDSLLLSMTNASDLVASQRTSAPSSSSKEISFSLTATGDLPLAAQRPHAARSPSPVESAAQRTAQRTGVLAASQDHHALRDVLGDALGPADVLTDAATRGLGVTASTAKRTASPGSLPTRTLPVLNQSSGEVIKALTNRTAQRGTGTLAASQDQHALRDVLGDALGLDSHPGRRPSQSTMEGARGTQHSRSTGSVKEETIPPFDEVSICGDGGIFMDQVSPGWKVSSRRDGQRAQSSSSSGSREGVRQKPPSRNEVHLVTEDASSKKGTRAPSLRAAGELHVAAKVDADGRNTPSSLAGFDERPRPHSNTPPLEIFASKRIGGSESQSSLVGAAGRPTTPESARQAKVEKERARDRQRTGALSIPFHDTAPGAPSPQPPKAVLERMAEHERKQQEKVAETKAAKAQTAPAMRSRGLTSSQDKRSRTIAQ